MEHPLCIFSSHYSLLDSILTVDAPIKDKATKEYIKKLPDNRPLSIFEIAVAHSLPQVVIADSSLTGFWQIYKNSKECDVQPIFWWKTTVCADHLDHSDESKSTESSIYIGFKNSQSYYDAVKMITEAQTKGGEKPRISWSYLNENANPNFEYIIPFYSSFLARNQLVFRSNCIPSFQNIKPIFLRQQQGLPFDQMLSESLDSFCNSENYEIVNAHHVKYYRDADVEAAMVMKCIGSRATLQKPKQKHFCSKDFSFEAYLRKINRTL